jgi:hypothetical protein
MSSEHMFDFSPGPVFANDTQREQAISRFQQIVSYLEAAELAPRPGLSYNRPALVRLTFEYARCVESQDRLLAFFFQSLGLGLDGGSLDDDECADLGEPFFSIAEFLMTNFFLPRRISSLPISCPANAHIY